MGREQWQSEQNGESAGSREGRTAAIEQIIWSGADDDNTADLIKDNSAQKSIHDYFRQLLKKHNLTQAEAVNGADLDKDYGVHIISGKRRTRRDNYIKLGIAMGLDFHEAQSMLKFVQAGQIYVLRQRDAAIMFCIQRRYSLMDTQLMLDSYGFEPLGDGEFHTDDEIPIKDKAQAINTRQVEQAITSAGSFTEVLERIAGKFIMGTIEKYFDDLLADKGIRKKELFETAGISPNTGYQLLRGIRRSKNRDVYLKLAIAIGLNIDETQRMLNLLDVGAIYPVVERDYAIYYGMNLGYDLVRMQQWLLGRGFMPL